MVPTANTPTAIDRTTRAVRTLCVPGSLSTWRQRTLRIVQRLLGDDLRHLRARAPRTARIERPVEDPAVDHVDGPPGPRGQLGVMRHHHDGPSGVDDGLEQREHD